MPKVTSFKQRRPSEYVTDLESSYEKGSKDKFRRMSASSEFWSQIFNKNNSLSVPDGFIKKKKTDPLPFQNNVHEPIQDIEVLRKYAQYEETIQNMEEKMKDLGQQNNELRDLVNSLLSNNLINY